MTFAPRNTTVGIDIDGVLNRLVHSWCSLYNHYANDNLTVADFQPPTLKDKVKVGWEQGVFDLLGHAELYSSSGVEPGAVEAVQTLMNLGYTVYIISAFYPYLEGCVEKSKWLAQHFPFIDIRKQLIFTKAKYLVDVGYLIDDCQSNVVEFAQFKQQRYTLDEQYDSGIWFKQPWSHTKERLPMNGIRICSNWDEIVKYLADEYNM